MFDPSGGTAPDIAGQNKCNPMAILLAFGMLLDHIDRYDLGHELRLAMLGCVAEGVCTADIGGKLGTREFTKEVIERMKGKF
jgi:isocitrate dehydrogenase (NAD+)